MRSTLGPVWGAKGASAQTPEPRTNASGAGDALFVEVRQAESPSGVAPL